MTSCVGKNNFSSSESFQENVSRACTQCDSTSTCAGQLYRCHRANFHHSFISLRKWPLWEHCASNCRRHASTARTMGSLHSISLRDMRSKLFCRAYETSLAFSPVHVFFFFSLPIATGGRRHESNQHTTVVASTATSLQIVSQALFRWSVEMCRHSSSTGVSHLHG